MLTAMLSAFQVASAYDFEADGIYYNITSMADLEVEVTSNGNFEEVYVNYSWSWKNTTPYAGHISIPATVNYNNRTFEVTGIGKAAFGYPQQYYSGQINYFDADDSGIPTSITSISLPATIKYIDVMAFQGCKIQSINIPSSVTTIDVAAFAYSSLQNIIIPNSVTNIGKSAFYGSSIMSLCLGNGLNEISDKAFSRCSSLLEAFCTSPTCPSGLSVKSFSGAHSALEIYVPSVEAYGFGRSYLTFPNSSYDYTGQSHNIEWTNNLGAYNCEVPAADCVTEMNAGEYTAILHATYSNGVDFTVNIPVNYTVTKAPLTLVVDDMQREYGEPNPTFTCLISGFVNGESEQSLGISPTLSCEATTTSNVGDYRILATFEAANYQVTYTYGNLEIVKAPLTVTVENIARLYGAQNPQFSLVYAGLKNQETEPVWSTKPTVVTTATQASSVGEYEITANNGVAVNYYITEWNPGVLTIEKRDLTAKALDCERLYGEANPEFSLTYIGFVNGDTKNVIAVPPTVSCDATVESNAGTYAINVSGGEAENYKFIYQDGTLTVKPLAVGFKDKYNAVTYDDMDVSTTESYFNYIPEIIGPYSEDDFTLTLWFQDNLGNQSDYVEYIIGEGDFNGKYVNTNVDRPMWVGRYIFNLVSTGKNPNVYANPSRAYVVVATADTDLAWDASSPIEIEVGEKIDLGITYKADLWCNFDTSYDENIIAVTSENEASNNPHWYATGLQEGETIMYFEISCRTNEQGYIDFRNSSTLSKRIKVNAPQSGMGNVSSESDITILAKKSCIEIVNMPENAICSVYTLQGALVAQTQNNIIDNLSAGLYIVTVGGKSSKVVVKYSSD